MKTRLVTTGWYFPFLISLLFLSCDKEENITSTPIKDITAPAVEIISPEHNSVVTGTVSININATDNSGVTKVEILKNGVVAEADLTAPFGFDWNTDLEDPGTYTLQAKAYDAANNVGLSAIISVTKLSPLTITFINPVFTDISVTMNGVTKNLPVNDSVKFIFPTNPQMISYSAQTSGKTNTGTVIGRVLTWSSTNLNVSGLTEKRYSLIAGPDFFFVYIRNSSTKTLNPIYVNYGLTSQTVDNIIIPGDNQLYKLGYYQAFTNTEIRAYVQGSTSLYVSWIQGTNLNIPFTNNQFVSLLVTTATNLLTGKPSEIMMNTPKECLTPELKKGKLLNIQGEEVVPNK